MEICGMFIPSSHLHASSTWISIPIKRSARTRLWHHLLRLILACRCCIQRTPGCREVASKFQGLALFQESNLKNMVQSRSSGQSVCDFGFRKHSISPFSPSVEESQTISHVLWLRLENALNPMGESFKKFHWKVQSPDPS